MRKRWVWVILGAGVLAVGVLAVVTREREPVYGGRKLSEWAKMYSESLYLPNGTNQTRQAAEAIREIGTNAIPYLAKWKAYSPSAWQIALDQQIDRIAPSINSHFHISFKYEKLGRAHEAFLALIALDNQTGGTNKEIDQVMIGDEASRLNAVANFPSLMNVLTNGSKSTRLTMTVAYVIGLLGTNASSAVPNLEGLLTDPELEVRRVATNALRRIRNDTNLTSFHK